MSPDLEAASLCVRLPVADLWAKPEPNAERVSQLLLGAPVRPLEESGDYLYIEGPDTYRGWIRREDLRPLPQATGEVLVVGELFAPLFPSPEATEAFDTLYFGTRLPVGESIGERRQVTLPERTAWMPAGCLRPPVPNDAPLDVPALLADARRFLDVPYLWGGGTPRGIDCSGFTQLLFGVHGRPLLRDAYLQTRHGTPIGPEEVRAGDLLFFGRNEAGMPTHVGIALGGGEYIHAHGKEVQHVEISRLADALEAGTFWGARHLE